MTENRSLSTGSQPIAWEVSRNVSAPCAAATSASSEVEHAPVGRLHRADRDEPGRWADRLDHELERDGAHREPSGIGEEREQHRGEIAFGTEHLVARLERGGDEAGACRELARDRDARRRGAAERREMRTRGGDGDVVVGGLGVADPPGLVGGGQSGERAGGWKADARRVAVGATSRELGRGLGDRRSDSRHALTVRERTTLSPHLVVIAR